MVDDLPPFCLCQTRPVLKLHFSGGPDQRSK